MISAKIDKCEYYAEEKVLPSDQSRVIEQAKLTFLLSVKLFKKKKKLFKKNNKKKQKQAKTKSKKNYRHR